MGAGVGYMKNKKDLIVISTCTYQKIVAQQKLEQMLSKVDKEIAQGTPMRDFEEVFAVIEKRIEDA